MREEVKLDAKVGVGVDVLWKALSKDLRVVVPKSIPHIFKEDVHVTEGDGGLGTIYLFTYRSEMKPLEFQKEKVVELEDSIYRISKEIIEGAHNVMGYSYYKTSFQLMPINEQDTQVDVTIECETLVGEREGTTSMKTLAISTLEFIKHVEDYLKNAGS